MNKTNFFYLLYLNLKNNKLKNIILIVTITIFLLLIIILFSGRLSIYNFVNNYQNSNFYYRIISVKTEDNLRNDNVQKIKELNISEISHIYKSNTDFFHVVGIENSNLKINGNVELYGKYDGINYHINSGRDLKNDNEIICSSKFYPGDFNQASSSDLIDLRKNGLEKEFTINFDQDILKKNGKYETYKTYYHDLKLVGTFDIKKDLTSYNFCYITSNSLEQILDESKLVYEESSMKKDINDGLDIIVLIDNYKNIDKVLKILNLNGFEANIYYELDSDFYTIISNIVIITSIIIFVISIICIYIFIKNILKENEKNIILFQILGFQKKSIKKVFFTQYLIIITISLIISIILSFIIKELFYYIFSLSPSYSVLELTISYMEMLILYILILIGTYLSIISILYKKVFNSITVRKIEE